MNKRIFSLVCIVLYTLLAVSIHCSEQKVFVVGNKSICGSKEINRSNEKNGIESKCETQLKNPNPKDDEDYKGFNCFNIFKRNKRTKPPSNKHESPSEVELLMEKIISDIAIYPEKLQSLSNDQITETSSNNNEFHSNEMLDMEKNVAYFLLSNPEFVRFLLLLKLLKLDDQPSNDKYDIS
ncbi:fam-c protein [Plasmodium yoelii]|uniref:Fam-c protein n=3 Tax=Plasmodium yoelii TaxID=5861 RepID=A0AAE9WV03_PLAYO|nr:fam-c protein [Plasmodium yoelii]EAA22887.1 hypothetical protein [Plasmodium yoelii yoelii]WBY60550.1 fam-c protein [Plasmodium yoelii yoelii]CDU20366.1 fam-c protein [Plasmodium yoelii]VTZ81326.1 fam-c protein [Plasmodium yoelii]|eukprot:XP_731322.1 fam-c protein [Plasmodium yoelii]